VPPEFPKPPENSDIVDEAARTEYMLIINKFANISDKTKVFEILE